MMEWRHPWALALVILPIALGLLARRRRRPALAVSSVAAFRAVPVSTRVRLAWAPLALRVLALVAMAVAIARPRSGERFSDVITHGVDMVVALDVSGSMQAEDFRPNNRLHVAKDVVQRFIDTREHDRLGLVVFAGTAFTQCPLTIDYGLLKQFVERVSFDAVEVDGTAIGMAIATSVNRLRRSDAKSRVVVLVTDGINNRGSIDPLTAAGLAKALGVRVYTVGVGTDGRVRIPVGGQYQFLELPLDEKVLRRIAEETGGYYFRATDAQSFEEALSRIGEMEKTAIETNEYVTYDELFAPLLGLALVALILEALLAGVVLRRLP